MPPFKQGAAKTAPRSPVARSMEVAYTAGKSGALPTEVRQIVKMFGSLLKKVEQSLERRPNFQSGAAGQNGTGNPVRHGQRAFRRLLRAIAVRALCALFSLPVYGLEPEGYLRVGSGKANDPKRACYDLAISGGHYRLGNECNSYGEFGLAHAISAHGATYGAMAMVNLQHPGIGDAGWSSQLEQIYIERGGAHPIARIGRISPPLGPTHPAILTGYGGYGDGRQSRSLEWGSDTPYRLQHAGGAGWQRQGYPDRRCHRAHHPAIAL